MSKSRKPRSSSPPAAHKTSSLSAELRALATTKLRDWGLTLEDCSRYGITVLPSADVLGPEFAAVPALRFTYFNLKGAPDPHFYRIRYLSPPPTGGWGAQLAAPQRYAQPTGSLNSVYLAPFGPEQEPLDWSAIATDPRVDLYITEGEGKGIVANAFGLLTVALGGVEMFTAARRGIDGLPLLEQFKWTGRGVTIVFDTDTPEGLKPQVAAAAGRLADWLLLRGATPRLALLRATPATGIVAAQKLGLDDYLLQYGVREFLENILPTTTLIHSDFAKLRALAERWLYIVGLGRFKSLEDHLTYYTPEYVDAAEAALQIRYPGLRTVRMGNQYVPMMVPEVIRPAQALLRWPATRRYLGELYRPGKSDTVMHNGQPYFNLWRGWACEYAGTDRLPSPARREVLLAEWFWALDNLFGEDPEMRTWVEHWLHYPLQNPGEKLNTFLLVHSHLQGIGKSFVGHMLAKHVYGAAPPGAHHAWILKYSELERNFNRYKMATSFIVLDDLALRGKKEFYERLKSDVTETVAQINLKHVSEFTLQVCENYYISTNEATPLYLDEYDRRAAVHCVRRAQRAAERYRALDAAFASGEAAMSVLWWARERYSAGTFHPKADAPLTSGKSALIALGRNEATAWLHDLVENAAALSRPLATAQELAVLYLKENPYADPHAAPTPDQIGALLARFGRQRIMRGEQVFIPGLPRGRYWALEPGPEAAAQWTCAPALELRRVLVLPLERKVVPIDPRAGEAKSLKNKKEKY